MPIYAYRCSNCGHAQDVLQKMSDPVLSVCPACGQPTYVKQVTAAGFQLKGSGWYVTDFRGDKKSGKPAEAGEAEAGAAKDPEKGPEKGAEKGLEKGAEKGSEKGAEKGDSPAAGAEAKSDTKNGEARKGEARKGEAAPAPASAATPAPAPPSATPAPPATPGKAGS